jgi:hypothetical protein
MAKKIVQTRERTYCDVKKCAHMKFVGRTTDAEHSTEQIKYAFQRSSSASVRRTKASVGSRGRGLTEASELSDLTEHWPHNIISPSKIPFLLMQS